jgi:tetratricopeptide (TPR) repeat protein
MKKYLVFFTACLILLSGCAKTESLFKKAVRLDAGGNTEAALRAYHNVLRVDPDYVPALINRAIIYEKMGDKLLAEQDYLKAYGLSPNQPDLLNNMGAFFVYTGRPLTGSYYLDRAIDLRPDFFQAYFNRAVALEKQERYERAVEDLNTALIYSPDSVAAVRERGKINLKRLYIEDALDDFTNVIYYDPYNAENYYLRGIAFKTASKFANALQDFSMAVRLNPRYVEALYQRAVMNFKNVDHYAAIADIDEIKKITDQYAPAYELAGDIYAIEDPVTAVANYLAARGIDPANARRYNSKILLMRTDDGRRRVVSRTYNES